MTNQNDPPLRERNRLATRDRVLDAAERLLAGGEPADFSMRALAAEAGVGFATPFNHFGGKSAIMQALSARIIERMAERFREEHPGGDALERTLAMARLAATLLLERPMVYRVVVGSLGVAGPSPSAVRPKSEALWSLALGRCDGLAPHLMALAGTTLPAQLAFVFRGVLSFWIAGELEDEALPGAAKRAVATVLLGFAADGARSRLINLLRA